jgi:nickel transport protein
MTAWFRNLVPVLLGVLAFSPARAHEIDHAVTHGKAVIVTMTYADHTPFSFESYEIFHEKEKVPFQVGRTDGLGRIVFIPDRNGSWRVRAFSEDGHGAELTVDVDAIDFAVEAGRAPIGLLLKILVGVSVLFGIFGLISMAFRRRTA